ncbi:MAG: hypothetical protein EPO11_11045 [Gammaproteobacteria bacterium]|nr:MAG: hypothetical protein EPO11_11045 [Gammaproteobacteria bacterium]
MSTSRGSFSPSFVKKTYIAVKKSINKSVNKIEEPARDPESDPIERKNKKPTSRSSFNNSQELLAEPEHLELKINEKEIIGKGAFATVYKGELCNKDQVKVQDVAVKKMKFHISDDDSYAICNDEKSIIAMLPKSPYLLEFFIEQCALVRGLCIIVSEYIPGGTLENYLKNVTPDSMLSSKECCRFIEELARGVDALHKAKIVHRDLKPANVLLNHDHLKICDFGTAAYNNNLKGLAGTPCYIPPEVIMEQPYTEKVDIYALGIMIWELMGGKNPYQSQQFHHHEEIYKFVVEKKGRPESLKNPYPSLVKLMQACWAQKPAKRPDAEKIVKEMQKKLQPK